MTARYAVRNWRTMKDKDRLALIEKITSIKSIPEDLKLWAKYHLLNNYLDDRMKNRLERLISNLNMKEVWETVTAEGNDNSIEFAGLALSLIEEWDSNYGVIVTNTEINKAITYVNKVTDTEIDKAIIDVNKVTNTEINKAIKDVNKAASRLAELIREHKKTIEHFTDVRLEIPKLARLHDSLYLNEIGAHLKTNKNALKALDRYFPSLEGILETLATELSESIKRRTPLKKPKDNGACRRFCIERLSTFFIDNYGKPYNQLVANTINTMFDEMFYDAIKKEPTKLKEIEAWFVSDVIMSTRARE